jgi:hypothetical protein
MKCKRGRKKKELGEVKQKLEDTKFEFDQEDHIFQSDEL